MKTPPYSILPILLTSLLMLLLTACGDSDDSEELDDQEDADNVVLIDATAGGIGASASDPDNKYTYIDLATASVVELTDAEAETSTDWDIAFKRTSIKLNGGVSGPGSVTGAVGDAQDDFYNGDSSPNSSVFLNATAEQELPAFDAVDATVTAGLSFSADANVPAIDGNGGTESWWLYIPSTFSVDPNPDVWNIVRGAAGDSFAKVHVTAIDQPNRGITLEMFIQGSSDSAFDSSAVDWTAAIGTAGGTLCYDIDTEAEVDCTTGAADWDIMMEVTSDGRGWHMWTNGGVFGDGSSGAAFGPLDQAGADAFADGASVPVWSMDSTGGVFSDNSWYAYDLQGGNKLWPNYRVYVVSTGSAEYKLQILSYYHPDSAVSANFSVRAAAIE